MLDQLVESNSVNQGNARRGGFLLTTLVLVITLFSSAMLYSLFAKDYGMGGGDLELSSLVAPVPVPEDAPPPPEPEQPKVKNQPKEPNVDTRTEIIQRMDQTPVKSPDTTSVIQNTVKPPREGIATRLSDRNIDNENSAPSNYRGEGRKDGTGIKDGIETAKTDGEGEEIPPPPVKKETPAPTPVQKFVPRSLGVVNGKAVRLIQPPYPAPAKAVRASGAVNVSVSIDVNGNVTSATAVSGHPLLRQAAEQAARGSKFSPTILSNVAVPVTGIIVYNFVAQ